MTRFFIINPVSDRRGRKRFESRENVVIRFHSNGKVSPAMALDVAEKGLRLETSVEMNVGDTIDIAFPMTADHIRCFGRVAWVDKVNNIYHAGISADSWHGIILGEDSWTRYKHTIPKKDRRQQPR